MTSRGTWRRRLRSSSAVLLAALVVTACGAARKPSSSDERAGLAFERESGKRTSLWIAEEDGSSARLLSTGQTWNVDLSPDGRRLLYYLHNGDDDTGDLYVREVGGAEPRLIGPARGAVWSPDGRQLAVDDSRALVIVDVESGKRREIVRGSVEGGWWGLSFSPDGKSLAYVRGETNLHGTDEYRADVFAVRLSDGTTTQLTHDGQSDRPVWGRDWITYRHVRFLDGFTYVSELRLMRPDGTDEHTFAREREKDSLEPYGLEPVDFSDDGTRLLACTLRPIFCSPVTFTVPDGKRYDLTVPGKPDMWPEDLASDGSEVLVHAGVLSEPWDLYAVPFEGGAPRRLVKNVMSGSWAG